MRIDITTPLTVVREEKKDSKIIKAQKSASGDPSLSTHEAEMESDLKRGPKSDDGQLIQFLEERKKRRAQLKDLQMKVYLKSLDRILDIDKEKTGQNLNVKV